MIKNFLLDLIFPRFCLGCQKELSLKQASFICEACFDKIILNGVECHACGLRTAEGTCLPSGRHGRQCRSRTSLKGLFAAGHYQDPILREAVNQFKYQSIESLGKPLAEIVIKYLKKENLIDKLSNSILIPIPLTWRRKLNRGFNQSEILAKLLSPVLNCPVINLLKRKKFNSPQAKIQDWKRRKENISGAFEVRLQNFSEVGLRKVILIDDVSTSGATLEEAARVLKEAGFKEIYGLVIAKG